MEKVITLQLMLFINLYVKKEIHGIIITLIMDKPPYINQIKTHFNNIVTYLNNALDYQKIKQHFISKTIQ